MTTESSFSPRRESADELNESHPPRHARLLSLRLLGLSGGPRGGDEDVLSLLGGGGALASVQTGRPFHSTIRTATASETETEPAPANTKPRKERTTE